MPSHPDRVRRNYHKIILLEITNIQNDEQIINIKITKSDIASRVSKKELKELILRRISNGIDNQYSEK